MRALHPITPAQLPDVLLRVALARPVHLWGAPGIGKSTMVEAFARDLGMDCVTLMATQLAPEDVAGVPQLITREDGVTFSRFAPPEMLVRTEPFVLFLDELNGARPEVQKSLYSLVLTGRVGDHRLPSSTGSCTCTCARRWTTGSPGPSTRRSTRRWSSTSPSVPTTSTSSRRRPRRRSRRPGRGTRSPTR
ncbi:ATP-binding protein [Clavibacter michiganensis]|uniref:ATP-binding protein n=1 Tax=Clavibacter michiganensis TaxID=28447 RepID=UPI0019D3D3C9|nr:MoxR family ATPase [Clavibacter michiganensis]